MATSASTCMSSAQLRKIRKPLIERKRRERINESLEELKTLLLQSMNKDESQFTKIEKADILEMAVEHLRVKPRKQAPSPVEVIQKYTEGFSHCIQEVHRCMSSTPGTSQQVHQRLMHHLGSYLLTVPQHALGHSAAPQVHRPQVHHAQGHHTTSPPLPPPSSHHHQVPHHTSVDMNNNIVNGGQVPDAYTSMRSSSAEIPTVSDNQFQRSDNLIRSSSCVPERFFTPIKIDIEGLDTQDSDDFSSLKSSPAARKLDFETYSPQDEVVSSKQCWIERVYEERKKIVSGEVWRPW